MVELCDEERESQRVAIEKKQSVCVCMCVRACVKNEIGRTKDNA